MTAYAQWDRVHPARRDVRLCPGRYERRLGLRIQPHWADRAKFEKGGTCGDCKEAYVVAKLRVVGINDFGAFDANRRAFLWRLRVRGDGDHDDGHRPGDAYAFSLAGFVARGVGCVHFGLGFDRVRADDVTSTCLRLPRGAVLVERDERPDGVGGLRVHDVEEDVLVADLRAGDWGKTSERGRSVRFDVFGEEVAVELSGRPTMRAAVAEVMRAAGSSLAAEVLDVADDQGGAVDLDDTSWCWRGERFSVAVKGSR